MDPIDESINAVVFIRSLVTLTVYQSIASARGIQLCVVATILPPVQPNDTDVFLAGSVDVFGPHSIERIKATTISNRPSHGFKGFARLAFGEAILTNAVAAAAARAVAAAATAASQRFRHLHERRARIRQPQQRL